MPKEGISGIVICKIRHLIFDMMLTGEPTLSGASAVRNHIQVTYSTKVDASAAPEILTIVLLQMITMLRQKIPIGAM